MIDQHLQVFIVVVEKGNFSRAAEELHMTQPAVSQYIQALERSIGTRLLERSNKYVRMNRAGEIVYHHAKEIVGVYTRMENLLDDLMNRASGSLTIGASYTFGEYVLPHILADLHKKYPLIQPSITIHNTKEIAELVLSHQLDVGIVEGEYKHEALQIEPFAEDHMSVVVSADHPLAQHEQVAMSDLSNETWIIREIGSGTREAADKWLSENEVQPLNKMEFGSIQIIKESVEAGLGITLLSQLAIRKELQLGTLKIVKGVPALIRQFSILMQKTPFRTKALDILLKSLRELN